MAYIFPHNIIQYCVFVRLEVLAYALYNLNYSKSRHTEVIYNIYSNWQLTKYINRIFLLCEYTQHPNFLMISATSPVYIQVTPE